MAIHRIPILGWKTKPDTSGKVLFEPYSIKAPSSAHDHFVFIFNAPTGRIGLEGSFDVPQNYVGSPQAVIHWTSVTVTGDVEWDFDYSPVGGDDAESYAPTGVFGSVNQEDTAPSVAHRKMTATLALPSGDFAAGDTVPFMLFRDGTDAGDTMTGAAIVHEVLFEYSDG